MEAKFKSISVYTFQQEFPDDESCFAHLAEMKWKAGFICTKCGHNRSCRGIKVHDRQCTRCCHLESPTSGTLFHKVKFPILKAFWIIYFVATNKKGIATTELSRKLQLRQKTCWLFKMKVMQAMASSGRHPLEGEVDVDEFEIGQNVSSVIGKKRKSKRLVAIAIEKKGRGVSRVYARCIDKADKKNLKAFLTEKTTSNAKIRSDCWSSHVSISLEMKNLKTEKRVVKDRPNFPLVHRVIMGLQAWLRGTHGHAIHLQYYLDEYCFRFNRHLMKEGIFSNLLSRMVKHDPCPYKLIIA